ncbi:MAG: aa3-type cytochrome oxidase subunit CtaJ [Pseudonocardiaceae bacterium]
MTSLEVILILAGVPLAIMILLGVLTLRPKFARTRPYRPGEQWSHPPVLWTANPEALRDGVAHHHGRDGFGGARGGARGNW